MVRGGLPEGLTCEQIYLSVGRGVHKEIWGRGPGVRENHQQRPSLALGWYVKGVEKGWLVWGGHSKRKNDRDEVKQVVRGWITGALEFSQHWEAFGCFESG